MSASTQTCDTPIVDERAQQRTHHTQVIVHHEPADPLREFVHGLALGVGFTLGAAVVVYIGLNVAGVQVPALGR